MGSWEPIAAHHRTTRRRRATRTRSPHSSTAPPILRPATTAGAARPAARRPSSRTDDGGVPPRVCGDAVRAHAGELVPLAIAETGCTATVGKSMQVPQVFARFDRYARGALEPTVIPLPPMEMPQTALAPGGIMGAIARRIPVGAIACITPYNFPIVNMAGKLGPALAMGNTVVVRPASQNPLAVIDLVRILHEVGFPPGVVNVVTGSTPATGEALVE